MKKYALKIECDVLNEMGLTVNRMLSVTTVSEPLPGDIYEFIIGRSSCPVIVKVLDILYSKTLNGNVEEVYCYGEEIDEKDRIKEVFEWLTFSID